MTSYILMIVTIISKVFGLVREKALAYFFGVGMIADVFLIAFQIPMTFTNIISGATTNGYIPIYNNILENRGEKEANKFTNNLSNVVFIVMFLVSLVGMVFAGPIVKAMAIGFTGEKFELAVFMTRVGMLSICATSVFSIFKAYLQIKNHFIVSVCHSILMNIIIILAMWISYKFGTTYLAWGILAGFVFQYIIFIPYIKKSGYRHDLKVNTKDENIKNLFKIIIPVLISTSVIELNFIISKSLASSLSGGAISTLNYAYKLQSFVTGIVVTSITTAIYPEMAKMGAANNIDGLKESISNAISTMSLLVIPASVGLFIFAEPIVNLLFVGGAFSVTDGQNTAVVLSFYAIGIIGIGIREIISRVFYALMDTKTPVINSVIMVVLNIILSVILSNLFGIRGLALATSLSFILGAVLIVFSLRKKIGSIIKKSTVTDLLKIIIATFAMGILSKLAYMFLINSLGNTLSLIGAIAVAGIVYIALLLILKVSEVYNLINKFRRK